MHEHIEAYVHNSKIGVLVHLVCNDEYTGLMEEFKDLARDIALHIAASKPIVIHPSELDPKIRNEELAYLQSSLKGLGDDERLDKLKEANRWINEQFCLLCQPFIKEPDISVGHKLESVSKELKESILVKRFVRWSVD